jgi:hypothetical protein
MNAQHTPGPWKNWTNQIMDPAGVLICEIYSREADHNKRRSPEADANARLIAAAPELLAALYTIQANAAESADWIRRHTSEAIAKAQA